MLSFLYLCLFMTHLEIMELPGLYTPPSRFNTAMAQDGSLFYMTAEHTLVHLSASGEIITSFSGSGMGPGELYSPMNLGIDQGKLWVVDLNYGIKWFDPAGKALPPVKMNHLYASTVQLGSGFMTVDFKQQPGTPANVFLFNKLTGSRKTLYQWTPDWAYIPKTFRAMPQVVPFNPARESLFMAASLQADLVFLIPPGSRLKIFVFEPGKPVRIMERDERPIPFETDWGMKRIKELSGGSSHLKLDAPKNFPIVRGLVITPDKLLVIEKWTMDVDRASSYLVIDQNGKERQLGFNPSFASRVLFAQDDWAYVAHFSQERDVAEMIKCKTTDIQRVCMDHPLVFQERKGAWVNLEPKK